MTHATPRHQRRSLCGPQILTLAVSIAIVVAGMVVGFLTSFLTLEGAAAAQHWTYPALLPLAVDLGIVAYVLLDQLAITLGARSRWLHLVAWGLAAFTVWANATLATASDREWRLIHALMPALWVLGVEALRFIWRRLHRTPDAAGDRIPWKRWVLAFPATFRLWRRMQLWGITSYPAAVDEELSRRHAITRLADKYGTSWRAVVPGELSWMLDGGVRMEKAYAMVDALCAPPPAVSPAAAVAGGKRAQSSRVSAARKRRAVAGTPSIDSQVQALAEYQAHRAEYDSGAMNGTDMAEALGLSKSRGRTLLAGVRKRDDVPDNTGPMPVVTDRVR